MATLDELNLLIEKAASIVGSQAKLAAILELHKSHITQMKHGSRSANWRIRGALRAIAGEDPARAFMTEMAAELDQSDRPDEKKAADSFHAILAAFPADKEKALSEKITQGLASGGNGCFRTIRYALHVVAKLFVTASPSPVNSALCY